MKLWLTSSEIADLALPGMPTTRQNVVELAKREDWARFSAFCRQRAGRGGGLEYHVNLLPVAARIAYFGAEAPAPVAGEALQAASEPAAGTTSAATLQLDARLAVLGALRAFIRLSAMKQTVAISYFVDLYNLGRVEMPAWAAAILPRLSTRTVLRWLSASREGETGRLAVDRGAGRRGQGVLDSAFDGEIKHFALAVHSFNELYTARQIHETVQGEFSARLAGEGLALPGLRAFEIRFKAWKQEYAAGLLRMMDPDGFRSKMRTSGSYAHMAPHLNALWQIDASPVDALCVDGRHSIYVCIDVWSRRLVLFVSKTPRSEAVQLLMRKAILAWGVPDAVKTDNGSDFVARATVRLFAKLQVEAIRSDAFSPWQKGYVERHIRTFQTDCARMLPGFVGHNVAQRKKIEGRKAFSQRLGQDENSAFNVTMTGDDLQVIVDRWADEIYAQREHGGLGRITPFARAASSLRPIRTVDADALAILLMQAPDARGLRTVTKQGVRVAGWHYLTPGILPGTEVFVRLDPADKGTIWLFDAEGDQLLGRGVNAELSGVDPAALLAQTRAAQRAAIDEQMAEVRTLTKKRVTERTVLDGRLAEAAIASGKLVAFPARSDIHTTPALDAGFEAAAIRRGDRFAPVPVDAAIHAQIEADLTVAEAPNITPLRAAETPHQRYRRARELETRMADGVELATADAVWLGGYRNTPEYRAHATIEADFGEAALR
ncbi:Mu transposase, C-terminal [Bosea sp. CRIB-10]|uniref:DNA-binding protein n=1 Tax=Bosea sp. CRIB-10 TaxID=378404 RepID=UPI0008E339DF|nr:DNA-binding protein [Bosea sp. CRIB-10]SFD72511.1 Mu transposase, C-terminal [Bosea sp. CRIB-10]